MWMEKRDILPHENRFVDRSRDMVDKSRGFRQGESSRYLLNKKESFVRELGPTRVRFRMLNRRAETKSLTALYNHSLPIRFNLSSFETLISL